MLRYSTRNTSSSEASRLRAFIGLTCKVDGRYVYSLDVSRGTSTRVMPQQVAHMLLYMSDFYPIPLCIAQSPPSLHLFSPSPSHLLSCYLLAFVCVHVCLCVCASVCLCAEEACSAAGLPPDHQTAAGSLGQLFVCHEQPTGGVCVCMCVWCVCCVQEHLVFNYSRTVLANFKQCDDFFCRHVYVCMYVCMCFCHMRHLVPIFTVSVLKCIE